MCQADASPLRIGRVPLVEDLQEHVHRLGVRLFDLVEQHDPKGPLPQRFGELATLLVSHVARLGAQQARHRVLFDQLAHVETYDAVALAEHKVVGGAYQPDVSTDGDPIPVRFPVGRGFDLHELPFGPQAWTSGPYRPETGYGAPADHPAAPAPEGVPSALSLVP